MSGAGPSVDERTRAALAGELGLSVEELARLEPELSDGLPAAVVGGLVRFEDALFELSL